MGEYQWVHRESFPLPAYYQSLVSPETKVSKAFEYLGLAEQLGFTPVAATVTGSVLRGMDHEHSDMDMLVIVAEKLTKNKSVGTPGGDDYQIVSLDKFLTTYSKSVPFSEALRSPFLVVREDYAPLLSSLSVAPYELLKHSYSFVAHLSARKNMTEDKRVRNLLSTWWTATKGTCLVPREFFDMPLQDAPQEFHHWLDNALG